LDIVKTATLEYRILWQDGTVRVVWAEAGELILDEVNKLLAEDGQPPRYASAAEATRDI